MLGKLSRRQPSAKRLSCGRSHNNVARETDPFGKAFQKRAEHSHTSETPDGHRTIVRGTSREGPLSMGPIEPSGGAQLLETVKGKELSKWAVQVEQLIPAEGPV